MTESPQPRNVRGGVLWPLVVVLVTAAYTAIPFVLEPQFFQRGDTAAQFAPTWFHFGEMVRDGQWPLWLDPASWAGGNYAGEALFGIYNPLNVLFFVLVSLGPDLALSTYLVKATVMVLLALGTYLLARHYEAAGWAAAMVAVALPFSGFTLFWDAGSWPAGLMAFAYAPWVWLTFRRALRGVGSPLWAVLAGVLAVLNGNPYGTLAVFVIGVALVIEGLVAREWRGTGRLVAVGVAVACFLPLVYLPLLGVADLAVRSGQGKFIENTGKLRPDLVDLVALSSPLHVSPIRAITGPMRVPATYLAWFVLPLLPWLKWGVLRHWRGFVGLGIITFIYFAMSIGPSKLWLFRWPLRVVEYTWLGVLILLAVVLSRGLARTHVLGRVLASSGIVALMGLASWVQTPEQLRRTVIGTVVVAILAAALLGAHLLLRRTALVAAVALLGVGGVLGMQVMVFGENESSRVWHVPSDVEALQADFADREGRIMQFADLKPLQNRGQIDKLESMWDTYLPGSMYHPAGVEAVNNYTGMGFKPFTRTFCMEYDGLTKKCGYINLWKVGGTLQPPLADLMKLDTVVVQPRLAKGVTPGPGWSEVSRSGKVVVLAREGEHPYPESRLSWVTPGIAVPAAETLAPLHEQVEVDAPDGGQLIFGMLGWPGWSAEMDGEALDVDHTETGLLTVEVPPGASGAVELTYRPPGLTLGLAGAGAGLVLALLLGVAGWRGARRRSAEPSEQAAAVTSLSGDAGPEAGAP